MGDVDWFVDDDAGYLAWLTAHPAGYVVNCARTPAADYLKLHRASCVHLEPERSEHWTEAFAKACATSAVDLGTWARARIGVDPDPCPVCRP